MITLHESNITSFPLDNGIGVLSDAIRAYAEEELNGMFEFYMEYDSEGFLVDELKEERIIKAKAQDKLGYQLFRIYSITKNHENDNLIVRAQHITYDLANNFVESLVANNLTKKQVMEKIGASTVIPHPFNLTSSNTTTISSTSLYRTNPLQMIGGMDGSVLQIWGGQIERDNFNLILHDRRGSDDGVKVTYEKNITGLEATFDISGLVTRIFPFVYIEETDNEPARLITVSGKYIDSPHINDYEKIYIKPIDYTHDERIDIQDKTDAQIRQQLTNIASQYFKETGNDKIKVDMEVQFEHLWETEEYKDLAVLELVGMGDTVTIEHSRLKVNATAIVNYIRYDCIAEKNEEVRLGSVKARLTDNVNRVVDVAEKVEQAQQTANQAIKTANGKNTIYYGPDEPTNGIEGDLWFRVVDGEYTRTYRHDGIQWQLVLSVDVRDAVNEAQQAKDEAQSAVDRANQATQQATNAINQAQTAFDEAQQALGVANNAMTQANSAFSLANDAFNEVESLSTMVDENTGEISTIKQSVIGLQTRVSDNEGNISNLTQIAQGLQSQVSDIEGNVSTLQQTAQGLQSSVTNLQDEWDNLEIGGRNLLRNSDFSKGLEHWESNGSISLVNVDGKEAIKLTGTTNGFYQYPTNLEENTYYTISFKAKSVGTTSSLRFGFLNQGTGLNQTINVDSTWRKYIFTTTQFINLNRNTLLHFYATNNTAEGVYITEIKLEKGNKATDWTPAPEDIDHQFSVITQTIDSITTRIGDAEGNITALQQTSQSLATRISDNEGNISTLTQTVQGLQTRVTDAEGNISNLTQLSTTLQTRMTNAEGDISTLTQTASSLQSTVSSLRFDFDNLEIGGRNLLTGTSKEFKKAHIYTFTGSIPNGRFYMGEVLNVGDTVTIRAYIKAPQGRKSAVRITEYYSDGSVHQGFQGNFVSDGYSTLTHTIGERNPNVSHIDLHFQNDKPGENSTYDIEYKEEKLEKGNKATDWTPAPEDMATQSQIIQLSDAINLRVMKGDVINQINLDTSGVLISGKKLILDGDTTVTGDFKLDGSAHIKDASIGTAQIGTIDAYKINANNLESLSSKTGELEVTGWLTISTTNYGIQSTYNYGDTYGQAYNARWFDGDYQLGYRYHKMTANVYEVTPSNTRGTFLYYTETFLGADMLKFREYNNRTQALNNGIPRYHLDIQAKRIVMGKNWDTGIVLDAENHSLYSEGASQFGERTRVLGETTGLLVGRINAPVEFNTLQFNNDRAGLAQLVLGRDADGKYMRVDSVRSRTYDLPANVYVSPNGTIGFAASSKKYKCDIKLAENDNEIIEKLKQLDAKTWVRKDLYEKGVLERSYGLIAEDLHELGLVEFVSYDDDGEVVGIHEPRLVVPLIMWNKLLDKKLTDVTDDVEWLKLENQYLRQKIKQLEEMIA